jgi:hypothetical protein
VQQRETPRPFVSTNEWRRSANGRVRAKAEASKPKKVTLLKFLEER